MAAFPPEDIVLQKLATVRGIDSSVLFIIAKSSNKNTVVYAYDATCTVRPYWIMFEKSSKDKIVTEDLNFVENNLAFGVTVGRIDEDTHSLVVVGHKNISFQIKGQKCFVEMDGAYHLLFGIYVHQTPRLFSDGIDGVTFVYGDLDNVVCKYLKNA